MQRFSISWRPILVLAGLIFLVVLVMNFNQRVAELDRLTGQLATVRVEGTAVMSTQVAMLTEVAYASSTEAVEEWAYVDNHWAGPGENPIILVPAENASPTPVPPPAQNSQPVSNWQIWWVLFFGDH